MSLAHKIKNLENQYQNIEIQISQTRRDTILSESEKDSKLVKLNSDRSKIIEELRNLRRMDYNNSQTVNFDEDR
jgi:hypothetical protein